MKCRRLNVVVFIGAMGAIIWGSVFSVYMTKAFASDRTIYWTTRTMPLRVEETIGSFELLINGDLLQNHLSRGTLTIHNPEGSRTILSEDIFVRLNNWYKVKSSNLTYALWSGMVFSVCITLLVIGLFQGLFLNSRKQR